MRFRGRRLLPDGLFSAGFFAATFLIAWSFIGPRALPWWTDGGEWLKYARGLLGVTWPMWGEDPLIYPPLFPSILADFLSLTGDPCFSIKFLAALVFALRPVAAYIFSLLVFRSRFAGVSAAAMIMLLPIHVEMLGWGGYPNLLCLSILMIAMGSLISWLRDGGRGILAILVISSLLVVFGHSLASLIYLSTLLLLLFSSLALRCGKISLKVFLIASIVIVACLIYWLAFLQPSRYVINNEAAYYHLKLTLSTGLLNWTFKSGAFLLLLYALAAVTIASALFTRQRLLEVGGLVAWLIPPLLLPYLHDFGIALDYARVFFFFTDPFVLLASGVSTFIFSDLPLSGSAEVERLKELLSRAFGRNSIGFIRRLLQVLLLIGLVIAAALSVSHGYWTLISVDEWYDFRDKYGDWEKLEALRWIKDNTPRDSVFVAEEQIARWIEGYSSRRTLMYAHPMYLFIRGELERAYVAKAILLSSIYLTNGAGAIYEPHDPRENMSTRIALKSLGALEDIFFLEANSSYVEGISHKGVFRAYFSDARNVEVLEDGKKIKVRYIFDELVVEKDLLMKSYAAEASLLFRSTPLSSDVKLKRLVIELKPWPRMKIWNVRVKPGGKLLLTTNVGPIVVEANSSTAFPFVFSAGQEAVIRISSLKGSGGGERVKLVHSVDLMKKFDARYVVIPRLQETRFKRGIELKPVTKPEYMHLLSDPSYRIAYQNDRVIILKLVKS